MANWSSSRSRDGLLWSLLAVLLLVGATSQAYAQDKATVDFPPALPNGQTVASGQSDTLIQVPEVAELREGVQVAETAPRVDFLYFPGQTYKGKPWTVWGDALAVGNNMYYTAIGDHLAPRGRPLIYAYDAASKELRLLVDIRKFLEDGELEEGMDYTPGKVHSRIDLGSDGWLYYSTHRGSTRGNTTDERGYKGDWIFRTHPETGETEIAARYPVSKHTIPASVLDPERMIFYGGTAAGNDAEKEGPRFLAYDVKNGTKLLEAPNGFKRYAIFAQSTGKVYWNGQVYDPETNQISEAPGVPEPRSATQETADGFVYGTTGRQRDLWAFNTRTEEISILGDHTVGGSSYTTTMEVDPTGRYLYYTPGAHGGSERDGTPIVQYDVKNKTRKVIAFLHPYLQQQYGYTGIGTFGSALSEDGSKLYVTWNGFREGAGTEWDVCAMTVIHIPESERQP